MSSMLSASTTLPPPMQEPPVRGTPPRPALVHASFQLWLLLIAVGALVGSLWLIRGPADLAPWIRLYSAISLISSVALLGLVPGVLFYLALRLSRAWRWIGLLQALIGGGFLILLYTDTVVFRIMRYHLNETFVNLVMTEGSGDALVLGPYIWITAALVFLTAVLLQLFFWNWRVRQESGRVLVGRRPRLLLRPSFVSLVFLMPLVVLEKAVWGAAEWTGEVEVLAATSGVPGLKLRPSQLLDPVGAGLLGEYLRPDNTEISWPQSQPLISSDQGTPDVLICVLDSWRRDALDSDLTPQLHAFAQKARSFENHLSSGNSTRFGLLGMLYGLHGAYWEHILEQQVSPVLVTALVAAGYEVRVFSAASMSFPEFRLTAWSSLDPQQVTDRFLDQEGRPLTRRSDVKDTLVVEAFEQWLSERDSEQPFFCFILLDSPHQPYFNPGGPYQPALENLNYIDLGTTPRGPEYEQLSEEVHNTYLNAVHHSDKVAGRLLDSLAEYEGLSEPFVIITGDHGEEFGEHGFWGHTSNFTEAQVAVPFLMSGPGVEPGVELRPTSHLDVSNTLLECLGADPELRAGYSLGHSLLEPPAERARVMGAWAHLGVWTSSGIFSLPLLPKRDFLAVYDSSWTPLPDREALFEEQREVLVEVAQECQRFLRARVD
ncbi:MAG TPA: DUF3413 domain-containing protein [Planctomycetes bacterium]|nr:DUF3413 domain-containing protein [Planctomycetota bacterium]HIL36285.1 DUF3413 domain-containing protein [Planctomycetota bacterium]